MADPASRQHYGPHPDQYLDVWTPPGPVRGSVVLIHGGYWREQLSCDLMLPLVPDFLAAGWRVLNAEYRRGAHGWSATRQDVAAALTLARQTHRQGKFVLIGHSVGGQLALLAAGADDWVVALAPVTDLVRTYHEGLGEHAVREYLGVSPGQAPALYREASPLAHAPPAAARVLVIHGIDDERVPIDHTRAYVNAVKDAGGSTQVWEVPCLPHRQAIDPGQAHWDTVRAWLAREGDVSG